jgi:hypothetical protein
MALKRFEDIISISRREVNSQGRQQAMNEEERLKIEKARRILQSK